MMQVAWEEALPGWQSLWLQDLGAEVLRCVDKSHRKGTAFFLGAAKYSAYDIEIPSQVVLCDIHKGRLWMGLDIIQPWEKGPPRGKSSSTSSVGWPSLWWPAGQRQVWIELWKVESFFSCLPSDEKKRWDCRFLISLLWTLIINSTIKIPTPKMWVWGEKLRLWSQERKYRKHSLEKCSTYRCRNLWREK